MIIVSADNHLQLLEADGSRRPFDPAALRDRLLRCFFDAGMNDDCYLAEEIALAVEYAFAHSDRADGCFGRGELDLAVVRLLEETGFAPVAECYRAGSDGTAEVTCRCDPATVAALLRRHLAGGEAALDELRENVLEGLKKLGVEAASPALIVELGRYYAGRRPAAGIPLPAVPSDHGFAVPAKDLLALLPPTARELADAGAIRAGGISRLFPCIRLTCRMEGCAAHFRWPRPTTEMLLAPDLARVGLALDNASWRAQERYREITGDLDRVLPVYLTIPDLRRFAVDHLGADRDHCTGLLNELAALLTGSMKTPLEKLVLN